MTSLNDRAKSLSTEGPVETSDPDTLRESLGIESIHLVEGAYVDLLRNAT